MSHDYSSVSVSELAQYDLIRQVVDKDAGKTTEYYYLIIFTKRCNFNVDDRSVYHLIWLGSDGRVQCFDNPNMSTCFSIAKIISDYTNITL